MNAIYRLTRAHELLLKALPLCSDEAVAATILSERTGLGQASTDRHLNELAIEGLVYRTYRPALRGGNLYSITSEGRRLRRQLTASLVDLTA